MHEVEQVEEEKERKAPVCEMDVVAKNRRKEKGMISENSGAMSSNTTKKLTLVPETTIF